MAFVLQQRCAGGLGRGVRQGMLQSSFRIPPEFGNAVVGGFHAAPGVGHGVVGGVVEAMHLHIALDAQGGGEAGDQGAVLIAPVLLKGFPREFGFAAE